MACSWMQQESSQLLRDSRGPVLTGHFLDLLNPPAAAWGALSKGQEAPQIPNDSSGIWLRITWLDLSLSSCSRNLEGCCSTALPKKPKKLIQTQKTSSLPHQRYQLVPGLLLLAATGDCAWQLQSRLCVVCSFCFICHHPGSLGYRTVLHLKQE